MHKELKNYCKYYVNIKYENEEEGREHVDEANSKVLVAIVIIQHSIYTLPQILKELKNYCRCNPRLLVTT